jgi:F-type H+-transporting ATPase subunit delta
MSRVLFLTSGVTVQKALHSLEQANCGQDVLQVELALLPAVSGDFGVMPGHVPTISQLRPGVVAVHTEVDKDVQKYFVSGGFAFAHADSSVEIAAVEAVPIEDLDPAAVKAGLAEYTARCATAAPSPPGFNSLPL